jgi:hypothetical protein
VWEKSRSVRHGHLGANKGKSFQEGDQSDDRESYQTARAAALALRRRLRLQLRSVELRRFGPSCVWRSCHSRSVANSQSGGIGFRFLAATDHFASIKLFASFGARG